MGFHEVRFPVGISFGSIGGPGRGSSITEQRSGAVDVVQHRGRSRRTYAPLEQNRKPAKLAELLDFFEARDGAANAFRFKDWADFTTGTDHVGTPGPTNKSLGTGDGVTTAFQLLTTYVNGGYTRSRPITKPVAGTVRVAVAGVELVEGVDWTVNTTTGIVTFTVAPTLAAAVTAGCEFDTPVRFGAETDRQFRAAITAHQIRNIERIELVEDLAPAPLDDERHFGGGRAFGPISANLSIAVLDGAALSFNPSVTGLIVTLPAINTLPAVGPDFFTLFNESFIYTLTVKDSGAATIVALGPRGTARLGVYAIDAIGTTAWRAS